MKLSDASLTEVERKILSLRSNIDVEIASVTICNEHLHYFLHRYAYYQVYCSDPMNKHKKKVKADLQELKFDLYQDFSELEIIRSDETKHVFIPAQKYCKNCLANLRKQLSENREFAKIFENDSEEATASSQKSDKDPTVFTPPEFLLDNFNTYLKTIHLTPIQKKYGKISTKIFYPKNKLKSFFEILEQKIKTVLNIPIDCSLQSDEIIKAEYFDHFFDDLKEIIKNSKKKKNSIYDFST